MSKDTQIQAIGNFTPEEMQVMQQTLAVGTSPEQFSLFIRTAAAAGLNPFLNHIFAIVYQGKMSLQISVEGIVFLAKKVEGYQGIDAQVVCENDEFKASRVNSEWVIDTHEVAFPRGKIIAAYAVAYREGFRPFSVLADISEVEHFQTSSIANQQTMWKKYTADMFKKHVMKRAAKGQFGIDVSEDDAPNMGSADSIPAYTPPAGPRDITQEVDAAMNGGSGERAPEPSKPTEADKIAAARKELSAKLSELGHTTREAKGEYLANNVKFKNAEKPTLAELTKAIKTIEMQIEDKKAAQAAEDDALLNLVE